MNTADLFRDAVHPERRDEPLCDGAVVLRGFALPDETMLLQAIDVVVAQAPATARTALGEPMRRAMSP